LENGFNDDAVGAREGAAAYDDDDTRVSDQGGGCTEEWL